MNKPSIQKTKRPNRKPQILVWRKISASLTSHDRVTWDADLRYINSGWVYKNFRGTSWQNVRDGTRRLYLKNAYRVLQTRARQGFVVFIPRGSLEDETRKPEFYDQTYAYLKQIGFEEI